MPCFSCSSLGTALLLSRSSDICLFTTVQLSGALYFGLDPNLILLFMVFGSTKAVAPTAGAQSCTLFAQCLPVARPRDLVQTADDTTTDTDMYQTTHYDDSSVVKQLFTSVTWSQLSQKNIQSAEMWSVLAKHANARLINLELDRLDISQPYELNNSITLIVSHIIMYNNYNNVRWAHLFEYILNGSLNTVPCVIE